MKTSDRFRSCLAVSALCLPLIWSASPGLGAPAALVDHPCIAPDNGVGTVDLPPNTCDYASPEEVFMIVDGLPPGTTIELTPIMTYFVCPPTGCTEPGGTFVGGERELFDATLLFQLRGTGDLANYRRTLRLPVTAETHSGPRTPGDPVQTFPTDFAHLQGAVYGDRDFESFVLVAGVNHGLPPSPGQTTLTDLGDGTYLVESFFDLTYRIDFVGAPGGWLDGLGASTTATVRITTIDRVPKSVEPDRGDGTATLPPLFSRYLNLTDDWAIVDGLPAGTTIEMESTLRDFFCPGGACGQSGGSLGGQVERFTAVLDLDMTGTGELAGFTHTVSLPAALETQSGPRTLGAPVQPFKAELASLEARHPGDQVFMGLSITAGTNHGLPSLGYTTLTSRGDGTYAVDSFFDITYQIVFTGAVASQIDGMSGTTVAQVSLTAFHDPDARPLRAWLPLVSQVTAFSRPFLPGGARPRQGGDGQHTVGEH